MEAADVVRIVESSVAKKNEIPLASVKSILESSLTDLKRSHCRFSSRPVAGGGAGGARAPPEIFRLEIFSLGIFRQKFSDLNYVSATKVEFCY